MGDTVYIKFERNNEVSSRSINVGQIADVYCTDKSIAAKIMAIKLLKVENEVKRGRYVFSVMEVIKKALELCPEATIESVGEQDFIIDYIDENKPWYKGRFLKYFNLILISIITFCGSAYSIVAYGNDVDIKGIFDELYKFFGVSGDNKIMEIMFCVGFAFGIIVFFNHFGGKSITNDPGPIEVEQSAYEKDICDALFDKSVKTGKKEF